MRILWLIAALPAAWTGAGSCTGAELDVLDRPALISGRAASSVLLAMTQAGKRFLAAGERGIVLYSDDGAASWRQAHVPVSVSLTSIRFSTDRQGWATGHSGVLLRSDDGGASWTRQMDGRQAAAAILHAARQAASMRKDASSHALLSDAQRLLSDGPDKPFFDICFPDQLHGFLVGACGIL